MVCLINKRIKSPVKPIFWEFSNAPRTWVMISLSPITKESIEDATLNKCSTASSASNNSALCAANSNSVSLHVGLNSTKKLSKKSSSTSALVVNINSTLLQVERYINSSMANCCLILESVDCVDASSRWNFPTSLSSKFLCVSASILRCFNSTYPFHLVCLQN